MVEIIAKNEKGVKRRAYHMHNTNNSNICNFNSRLRFRKSVYFGRSTCSNWNYLFCSINLYNFCLDCYND